MFFFSFQICLGILFFQCAQCVRKLFAFRTGTADKYVHVALASFPVMTLCPPYPYREDRLQFHGATRFARKKKERNSRAV